MSQILATYWELGHRVHVALLTRVGDAASLRSLRNECLRFLASLRTVSSDEILLACSKPYKITKHTVTLPSQDRLLIVQRIQIMIAYLDQAAVVISDPPDAPKVETTYLLRTRKRGRPRIEIDPDILSTALEMRGPTGLAPVFGTSPRTIRRRALELGLVNQCQLYSLNMMPKMALPKHLIYRL
jgi:hypothetical protein